MWLVECNLNSERIMKQLFHEYRYFVVFFSILFGADVLYALYQLLFEETPVSKIVIGVVAGFIATIVVLYIALKMMGLWRVQSD